MLNGHSSQTPLESAPGISTNPVQVSCGLYLEPIQATFSTTLAMAFLKSALLVLVAAVVLNQIPSWLSRRPKAPPVQGFAAPGFEKAEKVYRQLFEDGKEWGGSFALYHRGDVVLDLYGGYANEEEQYPWQHDTLTRLFSGTKAFVAIAFAMLYDRGHLDYNKRVADYWPEFAQNGKENITVDMLLSHQAGLVALVDDSYSLFDELYDLEKVEKLLVNQKPLWPPGTKHGYHITSLGLYADQLLRRVDPEKRGIQQFVKEELAQPFDLDISLGLPLEEQWRGAKFRFTTSLYSVWTNDLVGQFIYVMLHPNSPAALIGKYPKDIMLVGLNRPDIWQMWNPSNGGFGNARSLAKLFGILANGGILGDQMLLSPDAIEKLSEVLVEGQDETLRTHLRWGRSMFSMPAPLGDSKMIGSSGYGGQGSYFDVTHSLGIAYTTNYGTLDTLLGSRFEALSRVTYECLYEIRDKL